MKQIFLNISSVAKYEAKLLSRSWFFKIYLFIVIGLGVLGGILLNEHSHQFENITTLIPYALILVLNISQSFIVIFMSADYLKRDKQLDTSEVFYVRPLTNAEYLFGKVLGTMKPFLTTNIAMIIVIYVVVKFGLSIDARLWDYISYFLITIIPSLIFFIGVSTALMLIIGNQAITYIVMLGLSVISLLYTGSYFDYIFDLFMIHLPQARSDVMGISNLGLILNHRFLYILIGISSMNLSVYLFKRLAGSKKLQNIFLMISIVLFSISGLFIMKYTINASAPDRLANRMMELNSEYAGYPTIEVEDYDMDVEQLPYSIKTTMRIDGVMSRSGREVVFNLNGDMTLNSVTMGDSTPLTFRREQHLIIVELKESLSKGESLSLVFDYDGTVNEDEMYIDIKDKNIDFKSQFFEILNFDKRVAYIEPEWVVLTPESGWYVRPGVTYTDKNANWRREYFSKFDLRVKPLNGMTPVSQGAPIVMADSVTYSFSPEIPLRSISLAISRYEKFAITTDGIDYAAYIHTSNLKQTEVLEPIADTLYTVIADAMSDFERSAGIGYHLPRLTIVDVPEQMFSYKRDWSTTQELAQPELMLLPGAGVSPMKEYGLSAYDISYNYAQRIKYARFYRGPQSSDSEIRSNFVRSIMTWTWNTMDSKSITYDPTGLQSEDIANPHYLTSVLFNSKYNIVSDSLSWGNRLMEMYYMESINNSMQNDSNMRSFIGMSDFEQVMSFLQENGCDYYLADSDYASFITEIIISQGNILFAEAMTKMGADEFIATIKEIIDSRKYDNINIDELLDSVSLRSESDVRRHLSKINKPIELPEYLIGGHKMESGYKAGEEVYSNEVVIKNLTDKSGYVEIIYVMQDETVTKVVEMLPNQIKRVVTHTASSPRVTVNTMNSGNIPQYMSLGSVQARQSMMPGGGGGMMMGGGSGMMMGGGGGPSGGGGGPGGGRGGDSGGGMMFSGMMGMGSDRASTMTSANIIAEGEYILDSFEVKEANEIIVDNTDEELFSVSAPPSSGYLNSWLDATIDNDMLYKSVRGSRAYFKWTLTSGTQFYGESILSGYQIRSGDGDQYVTWKIPVEAGERYSIYFSSALPDEVSRARDPRRRGNSNSNSDLSYRFTVDMGDGVVDNVKYNFMNMQSPSNSAYGWEWIGDFEAKQDMIVVSLSNKSDIYRINADAVKAVKMDKY